MSSLVVGSIVLTPQPTRLCDGCGESFPASNAWHRFCSTKCRNLWHGRNRNTNTDILCPYCDRVFSLCEGVVDEEE